MFKRTIVSISLLFFGLSTLTAQTEKQELKISKAEIENLFLTQNIDLLAKKLEISQAEAQLIQAKLWSNPSFELSEVNFWKTHDVEEQNLLIGKWGASQQIAMHLEQEIETAGKRRKRINLQKLTIEERKKEFEIVLREIKLDLRNTLSSIQLLQLQQAIFKQQIDNTTNLIMGFENQLKQGNISQSEYIRLKAAQLQFKKELVDTNKDLEEAMKSLKNFINIGANTQIYITDPLIAPTKKISEMQIEDWVVYALENRPDVLLNKNLVEQAKMQIAIEKAERTPNITLGVDYDRGGGIMKDFVGFGIGFDLPIFNRNKGNIKEAQIGLQIAELDAQGKSNQIVNDIVEALKNYEQTRELYDQIDTDYEAQLDKLLEAYVKNFQQRNVSLIEYLDFVEAYIDNKNIILETVKNLNEQFEQLQFTIGKDL